MNHSSLTERFQPLRKAAPGQSRADRKKARDSADIAARKACYAAVDARDDMRCRVYGTRVSTQGGLTTKAHHHHLEFRSQGGGHTTDNVLLLSPKAHDEIHVYGTLRLEGDADARNEVGRLAGVKVSRLTEAGWEVTRFC